VAVFLWQHPSDVALGTSTSVAAKAGVLPSTLVRFAQHLGYAGFSDLQALFKEHLKAGRPPRTTTSTGERSADQVLVSGLLESAQESLRRAAADFDVERFQRAGDLIAKAEIVYLIGSKRAFPVTAYMSVALSKLGIRNILVDNVGSAAFDQIGGASARDVMISVNFSPYNSITAEIVSAGREANVPLVALTDSALSPVVPLASVWLEIVESDFAGFTTPAATLAVATALVLAVARRRSGSKRRAKRAV
jgi:DNA-binding MurR/RpiR family transcriptional regulator